MDESQNSNHQKVVELYKKRLMLFYQSFIKIESGGSTTHSKDEEKEPGIDEHITKLHQLFEILNEHLPQLKKLESKA